MSNTTENNKRIAKNTLLLYIRTLLTMAISLYTSRVILNVLGVSDYGIYNVVGGVVAMFSVISGTFSSSISRFITYELGSKNFERLQKIFSTSLNIQLIISAIIILVGEIVGVWFINYKMQIPPERLIAANWVFQCSLLTFVINLISIPYNASIIAHEKMSAFAYISILEVTLKLIIVYLLLLSPFDKLATYAILLVTVALIVRGTYGIYCKQHFKECKYQWIYDKKLSKEMLSFAGWSFFGNSAYMFNTQGVNILINLFFGVTFNAARGIATQVEAAIMQFANNFTMAINPQITKSYAAGDKEYMFALICRGAKYSYFLLLFFAIPFILEANTILKLWLKVVPEYAPIFLRLTMFGSMAMILGNTLLTAVSATGNIKYYQIWVTIIGCLVFPLTWLAYKLGCPVETAYILYMTIYFILVFVRLYFVKKQLQFPVMIFIRQVLLRVFAVSVFAFAIPTVINYCIPTSIGRLVLTIFCATFVSCFSIFIIGLEAGERQTILTKVKNIIYKFKPLNKCR